jgi:hypothetical protein
VLVALPGSIATARLRRDAFPRFKTVIFQANA